jgi:hypothetical protein
MPDYSALNYVGPYVIFKGKEELFMLGAEYHRTM